MARGSEFITLEDGVLRQVVGPNSRHLARMESAYDVDLDAPGGGIRINGSPRDRADARRMIESLSAKVEQGVEITDDLVIAILRQDRRGAAATGGVLAFGRKGAITPTGLAQSRYVDMMTNCPLSFGVGPAGTGKTFLAAAYGASLLRAKSVSRMVVTRPAVDAGEKLGFLPGDLNEKVDPYLAPILEALNEVLGSDQVQAHRDRREIETAPIAFMRGRTLKNAFVIVDEAQNTSRMQMKMVLTRLGENSRMVVTGDPTQIDLLNPRDSGLSHALRILKGVEGVGVVEFAAEDVIRHPLVERIVRAYDADGARGSS